METNKMTAVEWLLEQTMYIRSTKWPDIVEEALEMEKKQHGETWDDALAQVEKRTVWARAMCDFDEYWANKSKLSPPGEHCEEA